MRKLRNTGTPINVDDGLATLDARLHNLPGLVAAFVYGSYGTADQTPLSDVDLALVFKPGRLPTPQQELEIIGQVIASLSEDDVSVAFLNRASPMFQFRVIDTGRLLFCREEDALADFKAGVFGRHADFMIDYREFAREYDEALVEAYGK